MHFKVLDLFAGCGGLSFGALEAGHKVVAAVEADKWACDTYAFNLPSVDLFRSRLEDITFARLREFRGIVNLVVGGPPCQGFSVSGKRQYGEHLPSNNLVFEFVRVIRAVAPNFFMLENVGGLKSYRLDKQPLLRTLAELFGRLGYRLYTQVLQAADYGIPQIRSRLFIVGTRIPLRYDPFPTPTHSSKPTRSLKPYLTVGDAILDLPPLKSGEGSDSAQPYTSSALTRFQREMRHVSSGVFNHQAMKHSAALVDRFRALKPGECAYRIGRQPSSDGDRPVTKYKTNNQRLILDQPSLCVTANFQSTFVHPVQPRNLTAREAARLMSFPDRFVFKGRRTLMSSSLLVAEGRHAENHLSQYNQIGNAVPPRLAALLVSHLAEVLSCKSGVTHLPRIVDQLDLDLPSGGRVWHEAAIR